MTSYVVPQISQPFDARITLPGSKSIALRQLAISALVEGQSTIHGVPPCDDTEAMLDCLRALGVDVDVSHTTVVTRGPMNMDQDVALNPRMSGASTRLLIGLAALRSGKTFIDGHASLRVRTNAPLYKTLAENGCAVSDTNGGLPVTIQGPLDPQADLVIDGSLSSQYISALLLIAPALGDQTPVTLTLTGQMVSLPYIDITLNEMSKRGIQGEWQGPQHIRVPAGAYPPGEIEVEGDATAATYFAALATLHGARIHLTNLGKSTHQGDFEFFDIMAQLGSDVTRLENETILRGPRQLNPLPPLDMTSMPDAALTLIAMGPLTAGVLHITGLSSLHHKECDRLESPAAEFRHMGITAETTEDSIKIEPIDPATIRAHTLTTYHDHRMAMAFSIIGSFTGHLTVDDKAVVDKTFPAYWQEFEKLTA